MPQGRQHPVGDAEAVRVVPWDIRAMGGDHIRKPPGAMHDPRQQAGREDEVGVDQIVAALREQPPDGRECRNDIGRRLGHRAQVHPPAKTRDPIHLYTIDLFARGQPFTYDLFELGEFYLEYERLMDHWTEVLPGKVLRVQYEDVVTDLETQVRRILDYCDLPWNDACLKFYETDRAVKTASSEQVRKPIYASSMHRWRNYEQRLQPLIEVLEPLLRTLPEDWQPKSLGSG